MRSVMSNTVQFIGYPKCTTCKKCHAALLELGFDVTYRHIKEDNPTKEEIQSWVDAGVPLSKLFNTSGQVYRALNLKDKRKTMSDEELIALLATDGMLVKRPIVIYNDTIIVGNKIDEYSKLK